MDFFKRFVPKGQAMMVVNTEKTNKQGEEEPARQQRCKGIEFLASFSSRSILQSVECFSGGPADRVDAYLDTEHRQCLADILEELSSESQFICTTFRPELALKGKVFKVTHHEGTSSVRETTQEEVLRIVQAAQEL
ncbi:hypothetical protein MRX96_033362 [Rhipicephalus microplus]